jgi:hypothetical protein
MRDDMLRRAEDDRPFIVLTETKFRPVWVSLLITHWDP